MQCGILGWIIEHKNTLVEKVKKTEEIDIAIIVTGDYNVPFPHGSAGEESTCNAGDLGSIPGWEDPLEKGKATHSSILARKIPWTV